MLNSPLGEEPRNQQVNVIPWKQESSMLDWLQSSSRLIARDINEPSFSGVEAGISDFPGGEDKIGKLDYDISIGED
jgi:Protein of unknown function (DUF3134)